MITNYPPLDEVRKNLRPVWYRSPIDRDHLRELSQRSDARGALQAGGHFALFLATGAGAWYCWAQEFWLALIAMLFCHGTVASFFQGTAPHELGHGTVFNTAWLNRVFLYLFSLISWWDPFDYAASHTYHHRFTAYPDADRENLHPITPSLHPWLLLQLFTINLFSPPGRNFGKGGLFWTIFLTARSALGIASSHRWIPSQEWLGALHADQPKNFRRSVAWSRILLGFHGAILAITWLTGAWILPALVTLPSFIAGAASYFTGLTQHCGLRENVADFRRNSRSILINPLLEFLYWHMNWHTEHHMYANVPCYNLPRLARAIADDMPEPRSLVGAWREMRAIMRRQLADPEYEFDTPLPPAAGRLAADGPTDELANSIGDLAPDELR